MSPAAGSSASGQGPPQSSRAERIQAIASVVALVFALGAAIISGWALKVQSDSVAIQSRSTDEQTEAIQDQLLLNEELRDERERRYASRVSWWGDYGRDGNLLYVQNRTTVPINGVALRYKAALDEHFAGLGEGEDLDLRKVPLREGYPVITVSVIPPCSLMVIGVDDLNEWIIEITGDIRFVSWDHIQFEDVEGFWSVMQGGRLVKQNDDNRPVAGNGDMWLSEANFVAGTEPASDCGSG